MMDYSEKGLWFIQNKRTIILKIQKVNTFQCLQHLKIAFIKQQVKPGIQGTKTLQII